MDEAVRLREAGRAGEVAVVSCGPTVCQETLLAVGADRAVRPDLGAAAVVVSEGKG